VADLFFVPEPALAGRDPRDFCLGIIVRGGGSVDSDIVEEPSWARAPIETRKASARADAVEMSLKVDACLIIPP